VTAWLAVTLGLAPGWALARRRHAEGARLLSETVLWGALVTVAWMALGDLLGWAWSPGMLCVPSALAALVAVVGRRWARRGRLAFDRWAAAAAAAAGLHAALLAAVPSFGWDFRYSWALKAKVYALAGAHDFAWLSWPFHAFARVDYPPLWSDLLTFGVVLGAGPGATAAVWQAALVLGIAATCWEVTRPAPPPVRALAAAVGAWTPVIFTPTVAYSGYAEPMLAFGTCVALGALLRMADGDQGAWQTAAAGAVMVALTKNEGIALALGIAVAAWRLRGRRAAGVPIAVLAAVGTWRGLLARHGIEGFPNVFSPARIASRLGHLPASFAAVASWELCGVVLAWLLALPSIAGPRLRGVRIALAVWAGAVLLAYLVSPFDLTWHLRTSLDRVLAAPLPIVVALALSTLGRPQPAIVGPPPTGDPAG
jgi:hypothetical protein